LSDSLIAIVVLLLGAFGLCWWLSGFSARSRRSYDLYRQATAEQRRHNEDTQSLYRKSEELAEEGNRLRTEENALLRELIAALRGRR
jgi:hypothetical protein